MIELSISGHIVTMTLQEFTGALALALIVGVCAGLLVHALLQANSNRGDE